MPFTTTTTPPDTNAQVTVKFAGLMLLKPSESNNGCDIGIHRLSDSHEFQVIVVVNKPDRPPNVIRLVTGTVTEPFNINVNPAPGSGVEIFTPTATFDRSSTTYDELDFRWAINMQELHDGTDFNDGARPIATLNAGTLYTSTLTRPDLSPDLVRGTTRTQLRRFSADLAAAINLPTRRSKVELSWSHESGEPRVIESRVFELPRRADPVGTRYTVVLLNDPPISSAASHDELAYYYEVLELNGAPVPEPDRYRIAYTGEPTSDEIPCMPVVINPPGN